MCASDPLVGRTPGLYRTGFIPNQYPLTSLMPGTLPIIFVVDDRRTMTRTLMCCLLVAAAALVAVMHFAERVQLAARHHIAAAPAAR